MQITPPEIEQEIAERNTSTMAAAAPKAVKTIEAKRREASAAAAELETLESSTLGAIDSIRNLLQQLGEACDRREVLATMQAAADTSALSRAALDEFVSFQIRQDPYSQARYLNACSQIANLNAMAPAIGGAVTEADATIAKLRAEVRQTATAASVDLSKLLKKLHHDARGATDQKLLVHFEMDRLNFA